MSAVSSESPRASADLAEAERNHSAETAVPDHPSDGPSDGPSAAQGLRANEWLVDEPLPEVLADPGSVDMAWWSFFSDYQPPRGGAPRGDGAPAVLSPARPAAPDAQPPAAAGAPPVDAARVSSPAGPRRPDTVPAAGQSADPGVRGGGSRAAKLAVRGSLARRQQPSPRFPGAPPGSVCAARPRGRAVNMAASLGVPTATSVRSIPAKLLIDNRIVINNHLGRGRGGKVSFTHLIGYAVVRALSSAPEMNDSYAELDGKPAIASPEHVQPGPGHRHCRRDGSRQLLVPASSPRSRWISGTSGWPTRMSSAGPATAN